MRYLWLSLLLACSAQAETSIDVGPSTVSHKLVTGFEVKLNESFGERYKLTLGYISRQELDFPCDCIHNKWSIREQIFVGATAWYGGRLKFGIGPYYFANADRIATSNFRIGLHFTYDLGSRWYFGVDHFSTAGSGENLRICRDTTTWRVVDETKDTFCQSNDWNTGQDSWLRIGYRW